MRSESTSYNDHHSGSNFLSSSFRFADARHLKKLHDHGSKLKISPRRSVGNKCSAARSHRDHRNLALFLKQQLGRPVFPSRKIEDEYVDSLQPPSYSYQLFKDVEGLRRPVPPVIAGRTSEDVKTLTADYQAKMKMYKEALAPDDFLQKYMSQHCESPVADALVAIHGYDRLLAAHLHQLAPSILANIEKINTSGCGKKISSGRLRAKVSVVDGGDGYSDMNVISNKQDRQLSSHGITYDFSVISISVMHQLVGEEEEISPKEDEEEDEESLLSQQFSQSSIGESSCFDQSQNSQNSSNGSQGTGVETGQQSVDDNFTIVYEELKTNSPFVSRPVFR